MAHVIISSPADADTDYILADLASKAGRRVAALARAPEVSLAGRRGVPIIGAGIAAPWVPGTRPGMTLVVGASSSTDRRCARRGVAAAAPDHHHFC